MNGKTWSQEDFNKIICCVSCLVCAILNILGLKYRRPISTYLSTAVAILNLLFFVLLDLHPRKKESMYIHVLNSMAVWLREFAEGKVLAWCREIGGDIPKERSRKINKLMTFFLFAAHCTSCYVAYMGIPRQLQMDYYYHSDGLFVISLALGVSHVSTTILYATNLIKRIDEWLGYNELMKMIGKRKETELLNKNIHEWSRYNEKEIELSNRSSFTNSA